MTHQLLILPRAVRQIAKLPRETDERLREAIRRLAVEPRPDGCRKLRGREGYCLRVGDYRVVYRVDDAARTVTVVAVGHRRDVYR